MSQQGRSNDTSASDKPAMEVTRRPVDPLKESLEELSRIADDLIDQITIDETIGEGDALAAAPKSPDSLRETLDELDRLVDEEPVQKSCEVQVNGDKGTDIDAHFDNLLHAKDANVDPTMVDEVEAAGDYGTLDEIEVEAVQADGDEAVTTDEHASSTEESESTAASGSRRGRGEIRLFDDLEDTAVEAEEPAGLPVPTLEMEAQTVAADEHPSEFGDEPEAAEDVETAAAHVEEETEPFPVETEAAAGETAPEPESWMPEPEAHVPELSNEEPAEALADFVEGPGAAVEVADDVPPQRSETGGGKKIGWWLAAAVVAVVIGGGLLALLNRGPASESRQDAFVPGPARVVQETAQTNAKVDKTTPSPVKPRAAGTLAAPTQEKDIRLGSPRAETSVGRAGPSSAGTRPETSSAKGTTTPSATAVAPVIPVRPQQITQPSASAKPKTGGTRANSNVVTRDTGTSSTPKTTAPKTTALKATAPKATPTKATATRPETKAAPPTTEVTPPSPTATKAAPKPQRTTTQRSATTSSTPSAAVVNQAPKEITSPPFESARAKPTRTARPVTASPAPKAASTVAAADPAALPAEPVSRPPKLVSRTEPTLAAKVKKKAKAGTVALNVLVNEQGRVVRVVVDQAIDNPDVQAAAIDAVLRSKYEPAMENGKPVRAWTRESFTFGD